MIMKRTLLILLFVSLLTRTVYLFWGMPSLTNDEADLYTTSYVTAKMGSDQYDNTLFLTTGFLTAKPSIPIYFGTLPWLFTSQKSIFLARLPYALLNSITPLLFFLIVHVLTKNRLLALISFCVFNFSPWFSYLSSTGYEAYMGLFFLLLSQLILLTKFSQIKKYFLYSITTFLAFNSYMGLKPIFPFVSFIFLLVAMFHFNKKIRFIDTGKALLISMMLFIVFLFFNYVIPNTDLIKKEYMSMSSYFNKQETEGKVWFDRLTTQAPTPIKNIISNKITVRLKDQLAKYMTTFNLAIFFQKGDPSALYGTADLSGLFFLTDLLFFIIGVTQLYRIKELSIRLLLILFFIGGIPVALAVTTPTFILRSIILIIPITLLIAYGIYFSIQKLGRHKGIFIFVLLCIGNTIIFFTLYQTRIKVLNAEQWHNSDRVVSEKLAKLNPEDKVSVFVSEPKPLFLQYAFYSMTDANLIKKIAMYDDYNFSVNNLTIQKECPLILPKAHESYVYKYLYCPLPITPKITVDDKFAVAGDKSGMNYMLFK